MAILTASSVSRADSADSVDTRQEPERASSVVELQASHARRMAKVKQLLIERRYEEVESEIRLIVDEPQKGKKKEAIIADLCRRSAAYLLALAAEARNEGDHEAARELLRRMEVHMDEAEAALDPSDRDGLLVLMGERVLMAREFGTFGDLPAREAKLKALKLEQAAAKGGKK